jgi:hypothetical protein
LVDSLRIQVLASSSDWNPGICSGTRPSCHETRIYHSEPAFDGRAVKVGFRETSSSMGIPLNLLDREGETQRRSPSRGSDLRVTGGPHAPRRKALFNIIRKARTQSLGLVSSSKESMLTTSREAAFFHDNPVSERRSSAPAWKGSARCHSQADYFTQTSPSIARTATTT